MLGIEELSERDRKTVRRARRLERFLTQPFFSTEQFTGKEGKRVALEDALDGCDRILNDEYADYSEQALYMIGTVDEARPVDTSEEPEPPEEGDESPEEGVAEDHPQNGEANHQET